MAAETLRLPVTNRVRARTFSPGWRLLALLALALLSTALFMTLDAKGNWDFVLPFRGRKIAAIALVAYAIAVSTVLFQTMTSNRILTPSIMGFDALYMLIQTVIVFFFGSGRLLTLDPQMRFLVETTAMVVFAGALYLWLFGTAGRSLHLLILVGVIFGAMFRSTTNFLQRLIEPNDFAVLTDAGFASFNAIDPTLLGIASLITLAVTIGLLRMRHRFDVLALGRETAVNLGVPYRRTILTLLVLVTILVAVSTALVGPITFLGLIIANIAYQVAGSPSHRYVLPAAALIGVITLVGGQTVLERVFSFNTSLSIVIECVGGLLFILLVVRGKMR